MANKPAFHTFQKFHRDLKILALQILNYKNKNFEILEFLNKICIFILPGIHFAYLSNYIKSEIKKLKVKNIFKNFSLTKKTNKTNTRKKKTPHIALKNKF